MSTAIIEEWRGRLKNAQDVVDRLKEELADTPLSLGLARQAIKTKIESKQGIVNGIQRHLHNIGAPEQMELSGPAPKDQTKTIRRQAEAAAQAFDRMRKGDTDAEAAFVTAVSARLEAEEEQRRYELQQQALALKAAQQQVVEAEAALKAARGAVVAAQGELDRLRAHKPMIHDGELFSGFEGAPEVALELLQDARLPAQPGALKPHLDRWINGWLREDGKMVKAARVALVWHRGTGAVHFAKEMTIEPLSGPGFLLDKRVLPLGTVKNVVQDLDQTLQKASA